MGVVALCLMYFFLPHLALIVFILVMNAIGETKSMQSKKQIELSVLIHHNCYICNLPVVSVSSECMRFRTN